jgi:hypothetical protein
MPTRPRHRTNANRCRINYATAGHCMRPADSSGHQDSWPNERSLRCSRFPVNAILSSGGRTRLHRHYNHELVKEQSREESPRPCGQGERKIVSVPIGLSMR